jgi:hypothetical protein
MSLRASKHFQVLLFLYIPRLTGLFHYIWSATLSWKHFSFHPKRFFIFLDTPIFVRSRGIKFQYFFTFFNMLLFQFFVYILGLLLFSVYVFSSPYDLCDIDKLEIEKEMFSFLCTIFAL